MTLDPHLLASDDEAWARAIVTYDNHELSATIRSAVVAIERQLRIERQEHESKRGDWEHHQEYLRQRTIVLQLRDALQHRSRELRAQRRRVADEQHGLFDYRRIVATLAEAIDIHRSETEGALGHDLDLWHVLDVIEVPYGAGSATLAHILEDGRWDGLADALPPRDAPPPAAAEDDLVKQAPTLHLLFQSPGSVPAGPAPRPR